MPLKIRAKENCRWDLLALGEVMLRFDPGDRRIATTRSFDVYEGGGEYNVARGLKRCFGLETAARPAPTASPANRGSQGEWLCSCQEKFNHRWIRMDTDKKLKIRRRRGDESQTKFFLETPHRFS